MKKDKSILTLFLILIITVLLWQCGSADQSVKITGRQPEEHHDVDQSVQITAQEMQEFGVETAVAAPGKLKLYVSLPGEVVIPPDNLAHIHPRFPGIVKEVRKTVGDKVQKGETLAIIESNESMSEYALKSLINGTVIEMHMTRGEMVDDRKHGLVVANLGKVWVYLQVYQKDLPYVRVGQSVIISAGKGIPEARGIVSYIAPVIDEVTRTAVARVELKNKTGIWKPGLFVTGRIETENLRVKLAVPKTALETINGNTVVFVKDGKGFKPQPVHIGRENDSLVEIVHGLRSGQTYVSKNGFVLKAEMEKSEFGEEHGH